MQKEIMSALHSKGNINLQEEIERRKQFLMDYLKRTKLNGFVLGISGGVDSTLSGKLAQLAVEALRAEGYDATFVAMRLPYGVQKDEHEAQAALKFIAPDQLITYNIKAGVDALTDSYLQATNEKLSDFQKGNIKARARMIAQYAVAGEKNYLVIGTDQAAEAITGFFTKFGDGGVDLTPLTGLSKQQVRAMLKELGADLSVYEKVATADLLDEKPLQTDETELGIKYDDIDAYLEGREVDADVKAKLEHRYRITEHKRQLPANPFDIWWK